LRIEISNFETEIPISADYLLPQNAARLAQNCNVVSGALSAFKGLDHDESLSATSVKTLYQYEEGNTQHWVVSANELHFAKSPVSGDTYERVYFTGETEPRFFANDNISTPFAATTDYYKLGIPAPTVTPVPSGGAGADYRAYVYSFVNSYGDEGPPSSVGAISDYSTGACVVGISVAAPPTARAIDRIYLYRANSSASGTAEFQFALEATWFSAAVAYAVGDFVLYSNFLYKCTTIHPAGAWNAGHFTPGDDVANADLLNVYPKTNYDPPPSGMKGLISLPNGSFAGYSGNQLYLSEPGRPHAYPTDYVVAFDDDIVGISNEKLNITVVTSSFPYVVYGAHPSAMTKERHSTKLPGISSRGIVAGGVGVFYVSRQGIIFSGPGGFSNITEKLLKESDLAEFTPATLAAYWFDGKYFAFDSVSKTGFFIDMTTGRFVKLSIYAHAAHVTSGGYFYFVVDDIENVDENNPPANMPLCVSKWEGDTSNYLTYTWQSKEFLLPVSVNFSVASVILDQAVIGEIQDSLDIETLNAATFAAGLTGSVGLYPVAGGHEIAGDEMIALGNLSLSETVSFKLYVDGTLFQYKNLSSFENTFRTSAEKTYKRFYFELQGIVPVKRVVLATSVDEL
jgi:hypothetical protein